MTAQKAWQVIVKMSHPNYKPIYQIGVVIAFSEEKAKQHAIEVFKESYEEVGLKGFVLKVIKLLEFQSDFILVTD